MSDQKHYVVYWLEMLKDGTEEGARVVTGMPAALELAERLRNGFGNTTVKVFNLGGEIELAEETVYEQPKPAVQRIKLTTKGLRPC